MTLRKEIIRKLLKIFDDGLDDVELTEEEWFTEDWDHYFTETEGFNCSYDKARYVIQKLNESEVLNKNLSLYQTYRDIGENGEDADKRAYWVPELVKDTDEAKQIVESGKLNRQGRVWKKIEQNFKLDVYQLPEKNKLELADAMVQFGKNPRKAGENAPIISIFEEAYSALQTLDKEMMSRLPEEDLVIFEPQWVVDNYQRKHKGSTYEEALKYLVSRLDNAGFHWMKEAKE